MRLDTFPAQLLNRPLNECWLSGSLISRPPSGSYTSLISTGLPNFGSLSLRLQRLCLWSTECCHEPCRRSVTRREKKAETPIEYHIVPLSVARSIRFRHSGECAVSGKRGIPFADHSLYVHTRHTCLFSGGAVPLHNRIESSLQCK